VTHKFVKIGENRWALEVEEDPETKELMLTFPPEALAQVGWDFGDTLEWKIDPLTHEVTIQKKE
jgi:hypothetical protein